MLHAKWALYRQDQEKILPLNSSYVFLHSKTAWPLFALFILDNEDNSTQQQVCGVLILAKDLRLLQ